MDPTLASVIIAALIIFALSVVGLVAITHGQKDVAIQAIKTVGKIPRGLFGWSPDKKRLEDKAEGDQTGESKIEQQEA